MWPCFESRENGKITCLLCAHRCSLREGQRGICHVNSNEEGALKNLVYNHPSALNIDPVEKKPLYHFLPGTLTLSLGTVGCNFRCPFCQNWSISQEKEVDTSRVITPEQIVAAAIEHETPSISFTYNEPTIFYPYARDIGLLAKEKGIHSVFVTNGFQTPELIKDMASFVMAANVDLKSFQPEYYKKTLKGWLEVVKENLIHMQDAGIWIEITTLLVPGHNDSDSEIETMAAFISEKLGKHTPWHFSAFHPDYQMSDGNHRTPPETLLRARRIAEQHGMEYVYLGNIATGNTTYCPQCQKELIKRSGFGSGQVMIQNGKCPHCTYPVEGVWK